MLLRALFWSHLVSLLFKAASCSQAQNTTAQPDTAPLYLTSFGDFPDDLVLKVMLEQTPRDINAFMLTSSSLRERMINCSLLQRFLAQTFNFPPLIRIPFDPDLFNWLSITAKSLNSPVSTPKELFFMLQSNFKAPTPVVEAATLLLFDHFQLATEDIILDSSAYSAFVTDLILNNRSLDECLGSFRWFYVMGRERMEEVRNLKALMSKWFVTEYEAFKSFFFAASSYWNEDLFLTFCKAEKTFLPCDLTEEESKPFVQQLESFILDPELKQSISPELVLETCKDYIEAHRNEKESLYISFNACFNSQFTYHVTSAQDSIEHGSVAALGFVDADRYSEAYNIFLEMQHFQKQPVNNCNDFFKRLDFVHFMIYQNSELSRWHFNSLLPFQFYISRSLVDAVIKFYGSLDDLPKAEISESSTHAISLYKFLIRFGSASQFGSIISYLKINERPMNFFSDITNFRSQSPEFSEFVKHWSLEVKRLDALAPIPISSFCSIWFLEAALAHPGTIEHLKGLQISVSESTFKVMKRLPTYQSASKEAKEIIRNFSKLL